MFSVILMIGDIMTLDLIEFEIRHTSSDFLITRSAFSLSFSFKMVTEGSSKTSVIRNFPSTFSSLPFDLQLNSANSSLEFSAIARNVVIKQLLTAAVNRCSGDQIPEIPLGNSGGVAISMHPLPGEGGRAISGEHIIPFRSWLHRMSTL